jgi:hypothetical protein
MLSSIPLIAINIVSMSLKLYNNFINEKKLKFKKSSLSLNLRVVHGVWAFIIGLLCAGFIVPIILLIDPEQHRRAKQITYAVLGFLYGPSLALYLIMKPILVSVSIAPVIKVMEQKVIGLIYWRQEDVELITEGSDDEASDTEPLTSAANSQKYPPSGSLFFVIFSDIWNALYYTSLLWAAFLNGHVLTRFVWSSISNVMVNPDTIATYR